MKQVFQSLPRLVASGILIGVGFVAVVVILAGIKFWHIYQAIHAHGGPPPEAVTSMKVQEQTWQPSLSYVGNFEAVQGTTLSAEDPGRVVQIGFESGSKVKAGQLLLRIDASVEEAQLHSAEALLELARTNRSRTEKLRAQNAISEAALNTSVAEERAADAEVRRMKALISRKNIVAPFDGTVGIRMVSTGQYVSPGTGLVPVYTVDPIYFNFSVPQQIAPSIHVGQTLTVTPDSDASSEMSGSIAAIDPQADPVTRNIRVQATLRNPDGHLRSGTFAKAKILTEQPGKVLAIPASSISYAPYGNSVFVIETQKDPTGKDYLGVRQQFVQLGSAKGDLIEVTAGLKVGEEVVTSGVFKLRPAAEVVVNNSVAPGAEENPHPVDS